MVCFKTSVYKVQTRPCLIVRILKLLKNNPAAKNDVNPDVLTLSKMLSYYSIQLSKCYNATKQVFPGLAY